MSIESGLFSYLCGHGRVAAVVGTRIYEEEVPQGATYPAITYSLISANRDDGGYSMTGANGQVESRLQLNCWAATGIERRTLRDAVCNAMNGFAGYWGDVRIQACFIDDEGPLFEQAAGNEAAKLWGRRIDFIVRHEETVPTFIGA